MVLLLSRSAAARMTGFSRKTIQNYCKLYPVIVVEDKVLMPLLMGFIEAHKKQNKRGFPLGGSRPQRNLKLEHLSKKAARRQFGKRIEIIRREIQAMSPAELILLADRIEWITDAFNPPLLEIAIKRLTAHLAAASSPQP